MATVKTLVVLISGGGSNLQAIIDEIKNKQLDATITAVISNNPDAKGLLRAKKEKIPCFVIKHGDYPNRQYFDKALLDVIAPLQPELVVLAGFMRILSATFTTKFQNRLLNIHPSLLPKYKGLHTHQQALDNHDSTHGASVHYVTQELDSGIVVIQATVAVLKNDTATKLAQRVLEQEHKIYPLVIKLHLTKKLYFENGQLFFNQHILTKPLIWENNQLTLPTE